MRKLIYILIFLFFSFSFDADSPPPPSEWYQQFTNIPSGTNIVDMLFLDSLTGFIVTNPPKICISVSSLVENSNG